MIVSSFSLDLFRINIHVFRQDYDEANCASLQNPSAMTTQIITGQTKSDSRNIFLQKRQVVTSFIFQLKVKIFGQEVTTDCSCSSAEPPRSEYLGFVQTSNHFKKCQRTTLLTKDANKNFSNFGAEFKSTPALCHKLKAVSVIYALGGSDPPKSVRKTILTKNASINILQYFESQAQFFLQKKRRKEITRGTPQNF